MKATRLTLIVGVCTLYGAVCGGVQPPLLLSLPIGFAAGAFAAWLARGWKS
jgi:hypothetical protein